ncbi:YqzE family protein [Paenibacillus aestuarii]|uniref:YqzE family protein n=1 Tax=Paenibacillus aestuarii TaxID=516965 RepID=A0ABW0KGA1_9BACL|nr:YqzE family protein [Paenibacillus aestuarii]
MAKSDDLVKYITLQVISYMETPKDVRKQAKVAIKEQRESWQTRWFGLMPMAASMLFKQVRRKKNAEVSREIKLKP